ncbi:nitroreductase family protein [Fodinicola feengrottensis]|uniref:Nitroreductase family protein n=1 Tax=Fodinicola feengrottensis TaxID=435914 RepID=A0ABN2HGA3_9ACTN
MGTMTIDLSPDELLSTTRSVRKRLDLTRPVPAELITECVEVALQAPTGSNSQGWHWLVVTDAEQRAAIGGYYKKAWYAYAEAGKPAEELYAGDDARIEQQKRVGDSARFLADYMHEVPVLVLPAIHVPGGELPAGNQAPLWGSLLPAAWSYALAARARGLGTAWTTLHLSYEKEVNELLGLPSHVFTGVLLPTAYFTGDTFKPAKREPAETFIHRDRW